ncbi:MAG: peptide-methionine (S)-S-oxide reductase MsrA [Methyloligellaceae bacterium]
MSRTFRNFIILVAGLVLFPLSLAIAEEKKEAAAEQGRAIFAGGCFWCVESDFDKLPGVLKTTSGYTGGTTKNPTYKQVTYGKTGHYEAVEIIYDPKKVTYEKLLYHFWRTVDPTDGGGQFCDRGHSYKTAIFAVTREQLKLARESKKEIDESKILKKPVVTPVIEATEFYKAEGYHQDYYKKNPRRYAYYRYGCGRDGRLERLWGKQAHGGLKK